MYSFTINKKPYFIPAIAAEVSLRQFMELRTLQSDDHLGLLEVLAGEVIMPNVTGPKDVQQLDRELRGVFALIDVLTADINEVVSSGKLLMQPATVDLMGLPVSLKALNELPYGAYIHVAQVIRDKAAAGKNETFDGTDEIPEILAHAFYSTVTRQPYNEVKASEFKNVVLSMSFIEAMQAGNFFFRLHVRLWTSRRKRWLMRLTMMKYRLASMFLTNTAPSMYSKQLAAEMLQSGV